MKKDFTNLISLVGIQASNALFPLIVFPYILPIVGSELYSKIVVSESIIIIVLTIVIYSFDIEGVAKATKYHHLKDTKKISLLFSSILYIRLSLFLICALLIVITDIFIENNYTGLLIWWLLFPLGYIIQSSWLFLGLERNTPIALINIFSKLVSIILVIKMINEKEDHVLLPIIIGGVFFSYSLLTLLYINYKLKIKLHLVSFNKLMNTFLSSRTIFFGNMSVVLYKDINVLILDAAGANASIIASYSIAEKIIKGFQAMTRPLNQLFFPKVIRSINNLIKPNSDAWKKILKLTYPQLFLVSLGLSIAIPFYYILGDKLPFIKEFTNRAEIELLILLMLPSILFGITNFMFGVAGLNFLHNSKYFFYSLLTVGLLNIFHCYLLSFNYLAVGAALSFVISEIILSMLIARKFFFNTTAYKAGN